MVFPILQTNAAEILSETFCDLYPPTGIVQPHSFINVVHRPQTLATWVINFTTHFIYMQYFSLPLHAQPLLSGESPCKPSINNILHLKDHVLYCMTEEN